MSELYTGVNKFGTASVNFDNNLTIPTLSSTQSIKFESPSQSQEVENVDLLSADDENSNSISNMFAKLYETYNNLDEEEIQILTEGYTTLANAMSNPLDNLSQLASDGWEYATGVLGRFFEVFVEEVGQDLRGSFIVNPEGLIKAYEVHDMGIGRDANELLRKVQAAQYVAEHGGEVCPAKWKPGAKTLKPGIDLVGKL